MARNAENVTKNKIRTAEEARRKGRNGGIASGKARRAKRSLKEGIKAMMDVEAPETVKKQYAKAGFDVTTNYEALVAACIMGGIKGNVKMMELIADIGGDKERDKVRRDMLELDRQRFEVEKEKTKAETKRLELQNKEMGDDADDQVNDGFIEALKGTAAKDWDNEEE